MWQLDNRTPFAAERGWVRDRDGAEVWIVAVKATFDIAADGTTSVCGEQPPVLRLPEHYGEPGKTSIKYDADLVLTKKTTDVIIVGHAHAPGGRPVGQVDVGFRLGAMQKVLRVFGERQWTSRGPSDPQPFDKMPIAYERAYGGVDARSETPEKDWDWRNPLGTGFVVAGGHADGLRLPNIEDPHHLIRSWKDRPPPAGFGVIANHWQPRVGFAGTYDEQWMKTRQPLLAADLDERWFQSAPADQQSTHFLRGGEAVLLRNLTPQGGDLRCRLPRLFIGFETRFYGASNEIHKSRALHTVILEPDHVRGPRLSLVWHSALPCHFKVQKLERTVVTLEADVGSGESTSSDADVEFA